MQVQIVDRFDDLPEAISDLLAQAEQSSFFLGRDWFDLLATQLLPVGATSRSRSSLRLAYAIADDDQPAILLPLIETPPPHPLGLRRLDALANYYSSLYAPICDPSAPGLEATLRALAITLRRQAPKPDILQLAPLDRDTPLFALLQESLRAAGWWVQPYFAFGNWHLPCEGLRWADYLAQRPGELRSTLKRKQKKLAATPAARLEIVTGADDPGAAIDAFTAAYAQSWKCPEPYPEFMPGLIRLAARRGWLRLGIAWLNDRPIAAQLWLVANGVASIYKLAYDEAHADLSPGTLLTARLIEHVLEVDRVREIDYLTGDDAYKRDWMTHRRERWGIAAFNPRTIAGALRGTVDISRHAIRRIL
jgi:hypothetical protein